GGRALDPGRRRPGGDDAAHQPRLEVACRGTLGGPRVFELRPHDDLGLCGAEVATGAGKEVAARLFEQVPADDELAPDPDAEGGQRVAVFVDVGEASLAEVACERVQVERLAAH